MLPNALRLIHGYNVYARPSADAVQSSAPHELCRQAVDSMVQGVCIFDANNRLLFANDRFAELYGVNPDEMVPGTPLKTIIKRRVEKGIFAGASPEEYMRSRSAPIRDMAWEEILSNGKTMHIVTSGMEDGRWLATHEDVTEKRRSVSNSGDFSPDTDILTGLPNRIAFEQRLGLALEQALRGYGLVLFWINVDQFRCINNCYGSAAGDKVLKEIAGRLSKLVKPGDSVVRMGGDEFAVIYVGINEPSKAADLARVILDELHKPYVIANQNIVVSTSIGLSLAPADALTDEDLIKNADTAVGFAKKSGGRTYRFFQSDMDVAMRSRQRLESQLRAALAKREFEANYQPIVDLRTGRVVTVEALLRWRTEDGVVVRPDQFLSLAEETGLIRPIGSWMFERACTDAMEWPDDVKVAVNLSMAQFRGTRLSDEVAAALATSGLPASRLEIEITESLLLEGDLGIRRELLALKEMGVSFAMDDFGTGYSSLGVLANFAFDKIKIDGSFVRDLGQNRTSLAILRSICSLALDLGAATTAESVETREQLEIVRREGCSLVQGFFFSPPVPAANVISSMDACMQRASFHMKI